MALSPSERITLIQEIASRLENIDWLLIDIMFKQFSLPWSERWDGNKDTYVLSMLADGTDQPLVELAQHLGFSFDEKKSPRITPGFWDKGMLKVFLSHLAAHRVFAGHLKDALREFGISLFVAHNDIEPTAEWQTEIQTALSTCDALVALLHPDFHASNWTDQEIGFAMGRDVPAFAVHMGQAPYGFIGRFQAFNGIGKSPRALARELFDAYRKNKQTQYQMAGIVLALFEESNSFAEAKVNVGYLEELPVWEPSFPARIRAAIKNNSQVNGSWHVPGRAERLAQKWETSRSGKRPT